VEDEKRQPLVLISFIILRAFSVLAEAYQKGKTAWTRAWKLAFINKPDRVILSVKCEK